MKKILLSVFSIALVATFVVLGTNAFFSDTETSTGNVFKSGSVNLLVDSQCSYNGVTSNECGTWGLSDLGVKSKFFNFTDNKPGDYGENTISLHVVDNPAHACMYIENMSDDDLGLTEPESEAGDNTDGVGNGELAPEIHFFAWKDDGDNIWETGEVPLFSNMEGPASDALDGKVYPLGVLPGAPLNDSQGTTYMGIYWCYGTLTVDQGNHTLKCDGGPVGNLSQTDKLTADIRFYVEQERNNGDFVCPALPLPKAQVVEGTTWSVVDTDELGGGKGWEWLAKAKVQEPNPASDFELQVGVSDTNNAFFSQNDTVWSDNVQEAFTLSYDGSSIAKLEVAGRPTTTYPVGPGTFGRIGINLKAPADGTTYVSNLALDVASLPITSKSVTNGTNSLTISGVDLSGGFVLSGNFTFDWGTLTNNGENQKVQFSID